MILKLNYFKSLFKKLLLPLLFLSVTRIVFYFNNQSHFSGIGISDFVYGVWFDCISIAFCFSPFYLIYLFPFSDKIRYNKSFKLSLKLMFHLINLLVIAANIADIEYFKYTGKRSTADLFSFISTGNDMSQLIGAFFIDFWWMFILLICFIIFVEYVYRKIDQKNGFQKINYYIKTAQWLGLVCFMLIVARGGFGLRPVGIVEATNFTKVQNVPLVLNTPFTILKTYGIGSLDEKRFYNDEEVNAIFNPIRKSKPQNILPKNTNVVILILESFGDEFAGLNSKDSYTPFFDSILRSSLYFQNGFSNGKKSIEAIPSILISLPALMDNPYITSAYANNSVNSLPFILKEKGYSSAFYHGASNGSMCFEAFSKQIGYDQYVGRTEYNKEADFDGNWGILDHKFAPWTARQFSTMKEPFLGTLFTLSSHHPYYIPKDFKDKVKKGPEPICSALNYSDIALSMFFKEAKKQPWFENTLFVLCADHTPSTNNKKYSNRAMMYKIPIAFYYPKNPSLIQHFENKKLFQHIDIMPTILDLLNISTKYYGFGQSFYQLNTDNEVVTYLEGVYSIFYKSHMLTMVNDKARNLYNHSLEANNEQDSLRFYKDETKVIERKTKAIIQRYSRDLIHNQTTVE